MARPSSTAATMVAKLSSASTISEAVLATAVPEPIAIPMLARLSAGASLTPSPSAPGRWPTSSSALPSAEPSGPSGAAAGIGGRPPLPPVRHGSSPTCLHRASAVRLLSPVTTTTRMPASAHRAMAEATSGRGGSWRPTTPTKARDVGWEIVPNGGCKAAQRLVAARELHHAGEDRATQWLAERQHGAPLQHRVAAARKHRLGRALDKQRATCRAAGRRSAQHAHRLALARELEGGDDYVPARPFSRGALRLVAVRRRHASHADLLDQRAQRRLGRLTRVRPRARLGQAPEVRVVAQRAHGGQALQWLGHPFGSRHRRGALARRVGAAHESINRRVVPGGARVGEARLSGRVQSEHLPGRHLAGGERARLVRADDGSSAQCLDRWQVAHLPRMAQPRDEGHCGWAGAKHIGGRWPATAWGHADAHACWRRRRETAMCSGGMGVRGDGRRERKGGAERTIAFLAAIRRVPRARQVVTTAGSPSGMAATASAIAILK
eukprot:scaffold1996_cov132-Isochrysis_galbana.AAC.13